MLLSEIEYQGPCSRDEQQMHPNKILEDPACRGGLGRFPLLIGTRRPMVLEHGAHAIFHSRIHQQTPRHDHEQRHDPLRLFERECSSQKGRIFQQATAPFGMLLAFVACQELLGWQVGFVACIGGQEKTTLLLNERLPRRSPRGQSPGNMGDHVVGLGVLAWAPPLAIARRGAEGALVQEGRLQTVRKACQRLPRIGFAGKGGATQFLQGFDFLVTVLAQVRIDTAFGLRLAGLRGDEEPPLLAPTRGRRQGVIPRALRQSAHGLRSSVGQGGVGFAQGCRDPRAPLHLGLGEFLEGVCAVEGTIGHHGGGARGGVPRRKVLLDDLATLMRLIPVAMERLPQHRNPRLVLDNSLQHDLVQSRPLIPTRASGHVHDLCVGRLIAVIAAIHMETRALEMGKGGSEAETLSRCGRNETREFRDPIVIEGIQRSAQGIIVEPGWNHSGRNAPGGWRILEKPGDQGEGVIDKAQAVQHHGFDGFTGRHVTPCRVLLGGLINDVADAEFVKHAGHEAEMIQNCTAVGTRLFHRVLL